MIRKLIFPIFIILISLNSCAPGIKGDTTPSISSGIEGYVTEGPMCPGPVRIGSTECPNQPYQVKITVLDTNNNKLTQFQSDVNGYFKITLTPGNYILRPEPGKPLPYAADQAVTVEAGQYTQVTILYDTGIR